MFWSRHLLRIPKQVELRSPPPTTDTTANILPRSLRNLPPRTRLLVGLAFLAWGSLGIYLIEPVEGMLGLEARSANSKDHLDDLAIPRISVIERRKD